MSGLNAVCPRLREGRKRTCQKRRTECLLTAALIGGLLTGASGQLKPIVSSAPPSPYIQPWQVPTNVREYMIAFGDRIQKPGNERVTLIGTVTDNQNRVNSATLVWEVPGRLRFERAGGPRRHWYLTIFRALSTPPASPSPIAASSKPGERQSRSVSIWILSGTCAPVPRRTVPDRRWENRELFRAMVRHLRSGGPGKGIEHFGSDAEVLLFR
jgi:hypothetical protein